MTNTNFETPESPAGSLTVKEANKLFRDAYSDIHKAQGRIQNNYDAPSYEQDEPSAAPVAPVVSPSTPEPTPTPAAAAPAEQPATPPAAATPATPAPAAPVQKTLEDMVKELPGELQTFINQTIAERNLADQRYRTTSGRLHKTRQEIADRQRELMELRTRVAQPTQPSVEAQSKIDHAKSLDEWNAVIQAEPTLAKAVDALTDAKVAAVREELTQLQKAIDTREQSNADFQKDQYKRTEWDKLVQRVPNVADIVQSPVYRNWIENLAPPQVRKIAESNDHEDALFVLAAFHPYATWYDQQERAARGQPVQSGQPTTPAATPATPAAPTRADEIANQRNNKPVTPVGTSVPPINVGANTGALTSQEAINEYYAQAYDKVKKKR